jgi:8-oxo-dGTP pyrophosphatase MutT (NUDIX family)
MAAPVITCGIYLFCTVTNKILICHATNASWKTWSIPKGLKDEGEDDFQTASRELLEETGIDLKTLNIISITELEPAKYEKQNKILHSYLIITDASLADHTFVCSTLVKGGHPEIDRWSWVSPEDLSTKVHESQKVNYDLIKKLTGKYC